MLYISTRSHSDSYTAYRALRESYAPDGGMFVPLRLPKFSDAELLHFKDEPFGQIVASVLNLFFSAKLSAWDIDCCIGKTPVRVQTMQHRVSIVHIWQNKQTDLDFLINALYSKLCDSLSAPDAKQPTEWGATAIRIALLFGIFAELAHYDISFADVAVSCEDITALTSVWYAREMGLPIGIIVCACSEESGIWDLFHRGSCCVGKDSRYATGIERMIFASMGHTEACRYAEKVDRSGSYSVPAALPSSFGKDLFVAVIGAERTQTVINSVYRSVACRIDSKTADAYGAMQDYRAKTGESRMTVFVAEAMPDNKANDTV